MLKEPEKFIRLYCYSYSTRFNMLNSFSVSIHEKYLNHYLTNIRFRDDNDITLETNWFRTKQEALVDIMDRINKCVLK